MTAHEEDPRRRTGQAGEEAAARYLTAQGLRVVARNWRCRLGELDMVALDGATVVIVEVKTRRSARFGHPAEAVDSRKQARLLRLALAFLQERRWDGRPVRFDVIAVLPGGPDGWRMEWIRDAFGS